MIEFSILKKDKPETTFVCVTRKKHEADGSKVVLKDLQPGVYSVRIKAVSLAGGEYSAKQYFTFDGTSPSSSNKAWIIFGLVILLILCSVIFTSYYFKHRLLTMLKNNDDQMILMHEMQPVDFDFVSNHMGEYDAHSDQELF